MSSHAQKQHTFNSNINIYIYKVNLHFQYTCIRSTKEKRQLNSSAEKVCLRNNSIGSSWGGWGWSRLLQLSIQL